MVVISRREIGPLLRGTPAKLLLLLHTRFFFLVNSSYAIKAGFGLSG